MPLKRTADAFIEWILGHSKKVIRAQRLAPNVTGKRIIAEIVSAIALDQSVLLVGPRGCGKSYCIETAISDALERGLISPYSSDVKHLFIQGNSEIPRDYLAEDDLVFKLLQGSIIPRIRSAPLFKAAERNEDGELLVHDGNARWPLLKGKRFVLFLDEINRFSNGVLDSLLSILEERKAVIGGEAVGVPVSVCMTMNPPGYDATAKNLSPPLAARIGRTIRLSTPDLDTLSDEIILAKVERSFPGIKWPVFKDQNIELTLPMVLLRAAGLTTLCMWGGTNSAATRPGLLYLTPETLDLIDNVTRVSAVARKTMDELTGLSLFGPDGRAAADWAVSAIGRAHSEVGKSKTKVGVVGSQHFISTAVSTISGKLVDNFSSASRPDLTIKKELAIRNLAIEMFNNRKITRLLERNCDRDDSPMWKQFAVFGFEKSWTQRLLWRTRAAGDETIDVILTTIQDKRSTIASPNHVEAAFRFFEELRTETRRFQEREKDNANTSQLRDLAERCYDALAPMVDQTLLDLSDSIPFITDFVTLNAFRRACEENKLASPDRARLATQIDLIWRSISDNPDDISAAEKYVDDTAPELKDVLYQLLTKGYEGMDVPPAPDKTLLGKVLNLTGIKRESSDDAATRMRYNALSRLLEHETNQIADGSLKVSKDDQIRK